MQANKPKPRSKQGAKPPHNSNTRPKKKALPKKAVARGKTMPRQSHMLSPHHPAMIPTAIRSGQAFPYTGLVRASLVVGSDMITLLAITNTGTAATVCSQVSLNASSVIFRSNFTIPTIATADDAGGPTSGRAMKVGLSLVNSTSLLNRGGKVFHLNANARVRLPAAPSALTFAQATDFINGLIAMPNTTQYDGTDFGHTREFTCGVVDNVTYNDFDEWHGTESLDDFWAHIAIWPSASPRDRPMSTCFLIFQTPSSSQTYTASVKASYYTRWGIDTVPGQSMRDIPTAGTDFINKIHAVGDAFSNGMHTLEDIGVGAMAARFAPKLINAAMSRFGGAAAAELPLMLL